jgi:hypothetical protein
VFHGSEDLVNTAGKSFWLEGIATVIILSFYSGNLPEPKVILSIARNTHHAKMTNGMASIIHRSGQP